LIDNFPTYDIIYTNVHDRRMDMDVGVLLQTAHPLIRTGRFEEAIAQYDNVLEMDNNNTIALEHKGQVYYYLWRYENAIACYDQALAINQNLIAVWFN
jgi:tetratricopeptide (TPR) repeat protein